MSESFNSLQELVDEWLHDVTPCTAVVDTEDDTDPDKYVGFKK